MARPLRIEYPGAYYHVTARGNERKAIFRDDSDRKKFLDILSSTIEQFILRLHAYVLMDNHYHLLLRTPNANLSRAMRFFGVRYTQTINAKYSWDGPIFNTLSDVVYLCTAAFIAVTATASISSSRSMLVHLAPAQRVGEFFGLYAIAGTVTVWLGPLLVELFTQWSGDQRIGMSAIGLLFILGLIVLTTVHSPHHPAVDED